MKTNTNTRVTIHTDDTSTFAIEVDTLTEHFNQVVLRIGFEGKFMPNTVVAHFRNATLSEVISTLEECLAKIKEEHGFMPEEVL